MKLSLAASILWMLATLSAAQARNVDLSTVPKRDTVELTIYNSEDITLVRETRTVTFRKGDNPLQFSWANTLIDPTSVELRFLTNGEKLEVADTTFPHDKPQMLYWTVHSDIDGEATVEITHFTSGITWKADYLCIANQQETQLGFEGFVRISNNSGEEYADAHIRLVVGTINLVEKITRLAHVPMEDFDKLDASKAKDLKSESVRAAFDRAAGKGEGGEQLQDAEKQIVKEGLSEYFIYSIEGTETIPNGWSKRMRSLEGQTVPFKIQYRYRPQEYGDQLVRMYLLTNNKDSKLGTSPLPDGMVRVFRDNGRNGLSFLTAQQTKYVPIGDKIELNLGPDPEVVFELLKLKVFRDDLWLQLNGANVLRRVEDGAARIDVNSSVVGWDDHEIFNQRIRNYSARPIDVEVRRTFPGHITFRSSLAPTLHDFQTAEFHASVDAGKKADLLYEVVTHQGRNSRQNNITLKEAK